ncbi:MAG TPA: DUF1993 family protein [Caulobacteraceae bacterium]|jgi:hypothetical protein
MSLSMFEVSTPVLLQGLKGLRSVLAKAEAHAEARKIDPNALLQARLYPDMFPMMRQVQIATDFAKGAAGRLADADLPVFEDVETSFADLKARVDKAIAFIDGLDPAAFEGSDAREVSLKRRGETVTFTGKDYLLHQALPNFWFHVTTAYAILRHNGVEVGKPDFMAAG